ncbi:hypothetical protein [Pyxidicoccus trucidator]|uniref:hypothetical protein n=1 Tax=Pyxidicoccus trucidator TaxID=2709662 RepID=UPI0013DD242D|nr:hypothetical protein [Pyxidicoccus trucidator]
MAIRSCRSLLVPVSLLVLAFAGCGTAIHDEDGSLSPSTQQSEIRIANSLTTQALVLNAISANIDSNRKLSLQSLQSLFDPVSGDVNTRRRLGDPNAQQFMSYLVGCALKQGDFINWFDPLTYTPRKWYGQAGLCPAWAGGVPTPDCLERVSSCLLARNNALGRRVELSMRGEHRTYATGPNIYTLEAKTRPADHHPATGQPLDSFLSCNPTTQQGPARDCGWTADGIGYCTASGLVQVGAGGLTSCPGPAPVLGSSNMQTVLRVCSGVNGCDHDDERNLGEATGSCAGASPVPVVSFTCTAGQYFSVMAAPFSASTTSVLLPDVAVSPDSVVRYGLAETEVYAEREGAFYGNVFDSKALARGVNVEVVQYGKGQEARYVVVGADVQIQGSIYTRMFSCYDPAWASGAAYSSNRVCALPGANANCAATVTGACFKSLNPPMPGRCAVQEGPMTTGDRDYEQCQDTLGNVWQHPVTTFLHSACDTVQPRTGAPTCERT